MRGGRDARQVRRRHGAGLRLPRMLPVFSMSQTSSMIWPDGTSKRIDSPCPTASPLLTRATWQP